jgi:hypothetical protein
MPSDLEYIKSIQAGPYAKRDLRVAEAQAQSEKALDALTAIFDAEAHEEIKTLYAKHGLVDPRFGAVLNEATKQYHNPTATNS